ncbi:hypothetical protein ILUMI_06030, partial [Ignelater luminosus]
MDEIELAARLHGFCFSDSESSVEGNSDSDSDDELSALRPPPVPINMEDVVEVSVSNICTSTASNKSRDSEIIKSICTQGNLFPDKTCARCYNSITNQDRFISIPGVSKPAWHSECFRCTFCNYYLVGLACYMQDDKINEEENKGEDLPPNLEASSIKRKTAKITSVPSTRRFFKRIPATNLQHKIFISAPTEIPGVGRTYNAAK